MKIICIYNNYPITNKDFPAVKYPLFYLKPDTSILTNNRPFFIPEFSKDIHCQLEWVVRIGKLGKYVDERFASTYFQEWAVGVNIFDKSMQTKCIQQGLPWEQSAVFENSAAISPFFSLETVTDFRSLELKLIKNNQEVFTANTSAMIYSIEQLISHVSKYFTLKIGDLLFTGSPFPPLPLAINDVLEVYVNDNPCMNFRIK